MNELNKDLVIILCLSSCAQQYPLLQRFVASSYNTSKVHSKLLFPSASRKHCSHVHLQGRGERRPSSSVLLTTDGLLSQWKPSFVPSAEQRWSNTEHHWGQASRRVHFSHFSLNEKLCFWLSGSFFSSFLPRLPNTCRLNKLATLIVHRCECECGWMFVSESALWWTDDLMTYPASCPTPSQIVPNWLSVLPNFNI